MYDPISTQVNARAASLYGFGCLGEGAAILVCAPDSEEMKGCDEGAVRALMRQGLQGLRPYEVRGLPNSIVASRLEWLHRALVRRTGVAVGAGFG